MLDERLIEAFLSVVEYGNLTKAAESLYLVQSSVSHRVQVLEKDLGVPLFVRSRGARCMELTAKGKEFLPIALAWQDLSDRVDEFRLANIRLESVRVVAPDSMSDWLFERYDSVKADDSNISINISSVPSRWVSNIVLTGDADLGFSYLPSGREGLECVRVKSVPLLLLRKCATSEKAFEVTGELASVDELDARQFIQVRGISMENEGVKRWMDESFESKLTPYVEVDSMSLLKKIMRRGSWCLLPRGLEQVFSVEDGYSVHPIEFGDGYLSLTCYRQMAVHAKRDLRQFADRYFPPLAAQV